MLLNSTSRIGLALSSLLLLLLSACTEFGSTVDIDANGKSEITFTPPSFLNTRAIVPENLRLFVSINGNRINMVSQGAIWTGSTVVAKNSSLNLFVEWKELLADSTELLLARASSSQENVTTGITFSVIEESYTTTGEPGDVFDIDGDGISNLEERKRDTNPQIADASTTDAQPDVQIFGIGRSTIIDGRIQEDDAFWSFATYTDDNRNKLTINNMIRDDSVDIEEDPNPDYQWAAIHDEQYLTIFVWGKARNGTTIKANGDSGLDFFDDDSLEIFFDGDLSRGINDYDKVDDLLINIPLVRGVEPNYEENNSSAANKRIYRGNTVQDEVIFDVQDSTLVEFGTCLCGGEERSTWEVRINLAAAKIPIGRTFGFELQINRDDDGGARDSKWAWAKPPRAPNQPNERSDITWRFPVHMGKARLIPFVE